MAEQNLGLAPLLPKGLRQAENSQSKSCLGLWPRDCLHPTPALTSSLPSTARSLLGLSLGHFPPALSLHLTSPLQ